MAAIWQTQHIYFWSQTTGLEDQTRIDRPTSFTRPASLEHALLVEERMSKHIVHICLPGIIVFGESGLGGQKNRY